MASSILSKLICLAALSTCCLLAQHADAPQDFVVSTPPSSACVTGTRVTQTTATLGQNIWTCINGAWAQQTGAGGAGASLPAGAIVLIVAGTCPSGFAEETALNGKTLLGTLAAGGDVGTTGGSDTLTPSGTVSSISAVINHTHAVSVTDPGHTHVQQRHATTTGSLTGVTAAPDASSSAPQAAGPATASGATGITASTQNPAGAVSSITPTFTGTPADNRSAFVKVIFCRKT